MSDDWILPPGTVKKRCGCGREFASRGRRLCAYCVTNQAVAKKRGSVSASVSPFDPVLGGSASAPARHAGGFMRNLGKAR